MELINGYQCLCVPGTTGANCIGKKLLRWRKRAFGVHKYTFNLTIINMLNYSGFILGLILVGL